MYYAVQSEVEVETLAHLQELEVYTGAAPECQAIDEQVCSEEAIGSSNPVA